MTPATNQTGGALAMVVTALVAWMAGKGWIPGDQTGEVSAAVVTLCTAGYTVWANSKSNAIATVTSLPEVKKVVTTGEVANSTTFADNNKVVSK